MWFVLAILCREDTDLVWVMLSGLYRSYQNLLQADCMSLLMGLKIESIELSLYISFHVLFSLKKIRLNMFELVYAGWFFLPLMMNRLNVVLFPLVLPLSLMLLILTRNLVLTPSLVLLRQFNFQFLLISSSRVIISNVFCLLNCVSTLSTMSCSNSTCELNNIVLSLLFMFFLSSYS